MKAELERIREFPLEGGEMLTAEWIDAVKMPEPNLLKLQVKNPGGYYRVHFLLRPSEQSNINVVVCLPDKSFWNGKFLGTGNGGAAGAIAEGGLLGGVSRGYATANTDMGTAPDPDCGIGREEIWKDFGYRATHLMTVEGKRLTEWFYGRKPEHSYFIGGSTGGQQAFSEAQRYPEDYDGIVCLSPAFDRVRLHAFFVWNWQRIHREKDGTFTPEQAAKWRDAVVKAYGAASGSNPEDNFLTYPGGIRENPMDNPELQAAAETLLTKGQRNALRGIYDGPRDPVTGERFIPGFLPGTEAEGLSLADTSAKDTFAFGFFYLFRWIFGKEFDFMSFDFRRDLQRAIEQLGPILDANDPDLGRFKAAGKKLLVIGGSSDAIIPYTGFLRYYRQVIERQGSLDEAKTFFRFFLMPGFAHTIGGNGVQEVGVVGITEVPRDPEHDVLCALERWVEDGKAPERLLGTHFDMGADGLKFDHARPAFAYPNIARFMGGDPKDPANYTAVENEEMYG